MFVRELHLSNYRNYTEQHIRLHDGVNIFIGENAQGKTNVLESIYFLALGKSHRTNKDAELIRWGAEEASVEALIVLGTREHRFRIEVKPTGKRAQINGVNQSKMTDFVGHFQVVLFAPEDLQLVKAGPAVRRRFIDIELGQTQPKYLFHLAQYTRILQQRNTLLKQPEINWEYVEVFDEQLIEHGVEVILRRQQFLEQLKHYAREIYQAIANHREQFSFEYQSSIPGCTDVLRQRDEIEHLFRKALLGKRQTDARFGYTTVGPHRDDVTLLLNNQPVQSFASQGQQRTMALSLRLAEIDFIYQQTGEYPVLLLDDVLSELDDMRQKNLVFAMSEKVQTVITTTSLFQVTGQLKTDSRLFRVSSGIIQKEG
jgi:DNA replication and repair protein RecF